MKKIPKVIHYCWFGGKELPEDVKRCIDSWKKYLPDYKIIEWNESNFDINCNIYVKEAYENKKWAFVTDYVRLYILYNYGGIYMDTDVEIIKNLDQFLNNNVFLGFEDDRRIATCIIGTCKKNKYINDLLSYYDNKHFIIDGKIDYTTNVVTITNITKDKYNLKLNNKYQKLDDVTIYPKDYFCPKDALSGKINITNNTYCIHHFSGSWLDNKTVFFKKIYKVLYKILGKKITNCFHRIYNKFIK